MTAFVRSFRVPADATGAVSLLTQDQDVTTLKPNTKVLCIQRGRDVKTETFDGVHIKIPPGYFETEFGAAQHFQRRQIVPGTKHMETGAYQSWIGILGTPDGRVQVDDDDLVQPFTDEQLLAFGEKIELFDRSTGDLQSRSVTPLRTNQVRAGSGTLGAQRGPIGIDASEQASDAALQAAEHVLDPPAENYARSEAAEAAIEAGTAVRRRR